MLLAELTSRWSHAAGGRQARATHFACRSVATRIPCSGGAGSPLSRKSTKVGGLLSLGPGWAMRIRRRHSVQGRCVWDRP